MFNIGSEYTPFIPGASLYQSFYDKINLPKGLKYLFALS